ncbi:MAG: signal peptide peptidase SppA [Cytophagaceae bacterium]
MSFIKQVLAVVAGVFVYSLVFLILFIAIIGVVSKNEGADWKTEGVYHLVLENHIVERKTGKFLNDVLAGSDAQDIGMLEIRQAIQIAIAESTIKGVFVEIKMPSAGTATWNELRSLLQKAKDNGKFVVVYSEVYTEGAYYLASVADEIYMPSTGMIEFNGLIAESFYFKKLLDKLGIQTEIFRAGRYKSAIEPFMNEHMSDEDREQLSVLLHTIHNKMLTDISSSRKIPVDVLRNLADSMKIRNGNKALEYKLITHLGYRDEVITSLIKKVGGDSTKLNMIKTSDMLSKLPLVGTNDSKIAVLYANGEIIQGKGNQETIGSETFCAELRKLRNRSDIKAVVLRVNSPGGSALASDVIWREIELLKKDKKVVTLMSNVAASGGYYISMNSDYIMANPMTITGSIGVFGLLMNGKEFLENTLGVTTDTVSTGTYAGIGSIARPLSEDEKEIIQSEISEIYQTFLTKAAAGRHSSVEKIEPHASGRVWSGLDAYNVKLIDGFGSMDDAIVKAASLAGISEYDVEYFPEVKSSPLMSFLDNIEGGDDADSQAKVAAFQLPTHFSHIYQAALHLQNLPEGYSIQARMPYEFVIH